MLKLQFGTDSVAQLLDDLKGVKLKLSSLRGIENTDPFWTEKYYYYSPQKITTNYLNEHHIKTRT